MDLDRPITSLSTAERQKVTDHLISAKRYGSPRKVWVEDGHVFLEAHDGETITMTPEVAIEMGRLLGEAGANSLINRVMEDNDKASR